MKRILFITGTRADFGKLKTLMHAVSSHEGFVCEIFITGMHTLSMYGNTQIEVKKEFDENTHVFYNQHISEPMEDVLANTIKGLSRYIHENRPDMLVIHGDRVEALAGAITGAINNVLVAHIEGGERSGTIDELIRHSVSKMSHLHFAANEDARQRLLQMGERSDCIFTIGSPDIDVMLSPGLPNIDETKERYDCDFKDYGILLYHPVTTRLDSLYEDTVELIDALLKSKKQYIVVYPNNDEGNQIILDQYKRFEGNSNFKIYPSIRFEYFLTFLKHASFMIGNSSAGVREAPIYNVPSVDIGNRQSQRYSGETVTAVDFKAESILIAINQAVSMKKEKRSQRVFGTGNSAQAFLAVLKGEAVWNVDPQKYFVDIR